MPIKSFESFQLSSLQVCDSQKLFGDLYFLFEGWFLEVDKPNILPSHIPALSQFNQLAPVLTSPAALTSGPFN